MFKLTRKQLDVLGERQQRIVQGKEKFLEHLRSIPVHLNKIEALRPYMMQPMVPTAFGTADMYITMWTNSISRSEAEHYVKTGDFNKPVLLTCHFHNNDDKWYYAINRSFDMVDLPVLVRDYMHKTLMGIVDDRVGPSLSSRSSTRTRDYHALVPCFEEIKNVLFNSLGHRVVHVCFAKSMVNLLHPAGEYIISSPSHVCPIMYDEVQPVIGEDAIFNAKMLGIKDDDFHNIVNSAQYCNTNGEEIYSIKMDDRFWRKCRKTL